jgi:proteasome lid subunit RPN8/RPN11
MSDVKFGSWSVAESPITIEYSLVVIEEIRHEVAEGFQRLSRGGIEVGGVLYGTRDGRTVRVMAMRPIACEHARGPGFLFSDKDRIALNEQLLRDKDDPHLEGLISVGWFLSHTRSEITLSESDLEIYSIFFPAPWQVTMVVRPGRGGSMRAGFFVREADGTVRGERSYLEFNFPDRLAGVLDQRPSGERAARTPGERSSRERVPSYYRAEAAATAPAPAPARIPIPPSLDPGPKLLPAQPKKRKWPWLVAWAMVLIVGAVLALRLWMPASGPQPLDLAVLERDGELQIQWNAAAKPVTTATKGTLQILDGPDSKTVPLSPQALSSGKFTYQRKSGDVEVRMTVEEGGATTAQAASRFLGRPPGAAQGASEDLSELQRRKDELEGEVRRLRQENAVKDEKIRQLERTLKVLETKLGIDKQ